MGYELSDLNSIKTLISSEIQNFPQQGKKSEFIEIVAKSFLELAGSLENAQKMIDAFKKRGGFSVLHKLASKEASIDEISTNVTEAVQSVLRPPSPPEEELRARTGSFISHVMEEKGLETTKKPDERSTATDNEIFFIRTPSSNSPEVVLKFPGEVVVPAENILTKMEDDIIAMARAVAPFIIPLSKKIALFEDRNKDWLNTLHPYMRKTIISCVEKALTSAEKGVILSPAFRLKLHSALTEAFSTIEKRRLIDREIFAEKFDRALGFKLNITTERYITPDQQIGVVQPFQPMMMGGSVVEALEDFEFNEKGDSLIKACEIFDQTDVQHSIINRGLLCDGDFHANNFGVKTEVNGKAVPALNQFAKWSLAQRQDFLIKVKDLAERAKQNPEKALEALKSTSFGAELLSILKEINASDVGEALASLTSLKFRVVLFDSDKIMPPSNEGRQFTFQGADYQIPLSFRCILLAFPQAKMPLEIATMEQINQNLNINKLKLAGHEYLSQQELAAFEERVSKAKKYIAQALQEGRKVTPYEIIGASLPAYVEYDNACQKASKKKGASLPLQFVGFDFYRYNDLGYRDSSIYSDMAQAGWNEKKAA